MSKCATPFCRKTARKGRKLCGCCKMAKYRENNPMRAAYQNLKDNAKQRGKIFELTLEQFERFAIRVELIGKSGHSADSYTVDRIRDEEGYVEGNLQVLSRSANIIKRHRKLNYDWQTGTGTYYDIETGNDIDPNAPF